MKLKDARKAAMQDASCGHRGACLGILEGPICPPNTETLNSEREQHNSKHEKLGLRLKQLAFAADEGKELPSIPYILQRSTASTTQP